MGGSVGKVVAPLARVGGDIATFGTNELAGNPIGNLATHLPGGDNTAAGGSIYGGKIFGGNSGLFGSQFFGGQNSPYISGPFSLDPNQMAGDMSAINDLGQKQYGDTMSAIDTAGAAETKRASDLFGQMLPDIAESSQAAHLYDSTGYGQEVARQQSSIASQVAEQEAQQRLQALSGRQGFETGALQRGQSLEDFVNQANVAKTIGAQMAPQPASGKQNFGTVAQGVGALSPWAKLGKGAGAAGLGAGAGAGATASAIADLGFLA